MNRRSVVMAGVAVAALAGGGLVGLRRQSPVQPTEATPDDAALASLWALRFQRPEGGDLVMDSFRHKPLLLNFWASWCAPCLREMPLLNAFHQQHAATGLQVVGLAIDSPTPVREYLQRLPMSFPIGLAGLDGVELTRSLGNADGALPFSVVVDRRGKLLHRKLGALDDALLASWGKSVS